MKLIILICTSAIVAAGCEKMILGPDTGNTPGDNFNVLWKILDEKYPLFPLKNVSWDSLHTVFSSRINASTSEDELWEICGLLISQLDDGHITLFNRDYTKYYWSSDISLSKADGFSIDLIKQKYLRSSQVTGEGYITWGKLKNCNKGYIYVSSFGPAASGRDWIKDIDKVNGELSGSDTIIIDLRNNGGGFAKNDLYFASAYIDQEIIYYYSRVKTGPRHDEFGDAVAKIIKPHDGGSGYQGKIILLTNRFSASGSEVATLILKNLSQTVQLGDTTTGCLGEVTQVGQLPNGWTFNFPCTLVTLPNSTSPEGVGIAPDIYVDNTADDIASGRDRVLEKAMEMIYFN